MTSRRVLIIVSASLALQVLLYAQPAHAALQSTGILDLATQHFQTSLAKWKPIFTQAALTLFWLLATAACVWELGSIALRGASMDAALSFLVRFAFIEGLWLYIILNAAPIEIAIIDSFRKLGSTASGLRQELMPSEILDLGFALLWKTTKFVAVTGWSAPIVALVALVVTLIILLIFGLTAANMVLLVISQWFLVYGGIFFLGFGGAPWESDKAKNYLYLGLSIGAQFLGMAAVIGIGQSFIEAQYAQLSDDTALGELVVILLVGGLMFLLTNEIPKLFSRFVPGGYTVNGFGIAAALGGVASAAAALAAAGAMAKSAMETMGGIAKAASAAKDAAKSQRQPQPPPRSQTGVSSSGGSIGPAGGGSNGTGTRTQGPLGTMLTSTGISASSLPNGANRTPAATRAGTSTVAAKPTPTQKAQQNQSRHEGNGYTGSSRSTGKSSGSASPSPADATQPAATSLRARTHAHAPSAPSPLTDVHAPSTRAASETESDTRVDAAEAAMSSGRRADCEPLSDEATATGEADVQRDAPTSPEPAAAHADTSSSSNGATSAAAEGSEDASAPAPARLASTGVDGDADPSSARASTPTSSSAATSTSTDLPSAPAAASTGTSATTARSATAERASAPAAATTSAGTGAQSTPPSAATASANSGANEAGRTQSATASKTRPAEAASATPGAGEGSSESSKPASATPASSDSASSAASGAQRGSTSIGSGSTVFTAAKILGEHTLGHYRARGEQFKDRVMARVDNTTGGQIAQAIRKKYGIEQASKAPTPVRSATTISDAPGSTSESEASPAPPSPRRSKHPAHWRSGDDPMTDDQLEFLERKLGDSFDLDMTKAEAAILIDELIHEE